MSTGKILTLTLIAGLICPGLSFSQDNYDAAVEALNRIEEGHRIMEQGSSPEEMASPEEPLENPVYRAPDPEPVPENPVYRLPDEPAPAVAATPIVETATEPAAEESTTLLNDLGVTGSATVDAYSRYVWRGQYLDRDSVIQPGASISAKGFTVGWWGNMDLENKDALASDESDYYVSYSHTIDQLTLTGGHTWYDFPEYNTSSKEWFVSAGLAMPLNPVFSFYHDYEDGKDLNTDGDGNYYSLAISHSFPLEPKYGISLDLGATFGYVDGQWLNGEGYHVTPTAGLKIPVTSNMTIIPTIGYNAPGGDLKDENIANMEEKWFGGVRTAFAF